MTTSTGRNTKRTSLGGGSGGGGGTVTSVTAADASITVGGTATDPTIAAGVFPGKLLATKVHAPASLATYTLTTTLAAIDTTNATLSFTVPASGIVDVVLWAECILTIAAAIPLIAFGLLNHSGGAQIGNTVNVLGIGSGTGSGPRQYCRAIFHLTGLTPGALQVDFAGGTITAAGATATIYAQGYTGNADNNKIAPLVMQAFASI